MQAQAQSTLPTLTTEQIRSFQGKYGDHLELEDMADFFSVISNPIRLKTVFLLREQGPICVCDLKDIFGITAPAMSQHLAKLKASKIVSSYKQGQTVFYSLAEHPLLQFLEEGAS